MADGAEVHENEEAVDRDEEQVIEDVPNAAGVVFSAFKAVDNEVCGFSGGLLEQGGDLVHVFFGEFAEVGFDAIVELLNEAHLPEAIAVEVAEVAGWSLCRFGGALGVRFFGAFGFLLRLVFSFLVFVLFGGGIVSFGFLCRFLGLLRLFRDADANVAWIFAEVSFADDGFAE